MRTARLTVPLALAIVAVSWAAAAGKVVPRFNAYFTPAFTDAAYQKEAAARILLTMIYASGHAGRGLRLSLAWLAVTWLLCGAALWLWRDLRAIPVGFAVATSLALGLIVGEKRKSENEIEWTS